MRAPYDIHPAVRDVDDDEELQDLVSLAAHALSSLYSKDEHLLSFSSPPSSSTSTSISRTGTLAAFLLSPYILLSYSLQSIILTFYAFVPHEEQFSARLDILVPIFLSNVKILTSPSSSPAPSPDTTTSAATTTTVHFAQARVAVILAALQLPYLGAHFAAQPFCNLINVTLDHSRTHTPSDSTLPEKSIGPLRLLLEAIAPPSGNGQIRSLSTATPFQIVLHGRVISHSQELDPHEFQTLHESRVRTALRILADATTQPVGLRDSRTINEVLAELHLHEIRFSPACLAFPALAARNPNTAIQILTRLCDLSSAAEGSTIPSNAPHSDVDNSILPDLLDELAHTLDPSSLRSLDLVVRLVRDQTPASYSLPLHDIQPPSSTPAALVHSALGLLTQIVLLGTFSHRCMDRLTKASNEERARSEGRRRAGPHSQETVSGEREDGDARSVLIGRAVQDAMANLWSGTSVLDACITEGAVPVLMKDSNLNSSKGKGRLGSGIDDGGKATLPYRLDPSPQIADEIAWERELRNLAMKLMRQGFSAPDALRAAHILDEGSKDTPACAPTGSAPPPPSTPAAIPARQRAGSVPASPSPEKSKRRRQVYDSDEDTPRARQRLRAHSPLESDALPFKINPEATNTADINELWPAASAVRKVKRYEYVDLWFFTAEGCKEAQKSRDDGREDAMVVMADGSLKRANTASGSRLDWHLTTHEFSSAVTTWVRVAKRLNLDSGIIASMKSLNEQILEHPDWATSPHDLMEWHSHQRKAWPNLRADGKRFPLDKLELVHYFKIQMRTSLNASSTALRQSQARAHGPPAAAPATLPPPQ
ncbi:unnamed protein product, partial [Tilletia controversa]